MGADYYHNPESIYAVATTRADSVLARRYSNEQCLQVQYFSGIASVRAFGSVKYNYKT